MFSTLANNFSAISFSELQKHSVFLGFARSNLSKLEDQRKKASKFNKEFNEIFGNDFDVINKNTTDPFFFKEDEKCAISADKTVLFCMTGGTEDIVMNQFYEQNQHIKEVTLFHDEFQNSLPATLEIKYFLENKGVKVNLENDLQSLKNRLSTCCSTADKHTTSCGGCGSKPAKTLKTLQDRKKKYSKNLGWKLGLVGKVSPWLINENIDPITQRGCEIVNLSIKDLMESFHSFSDDDAMKALKQIEPLNPHLNNCLNNSSLKEEKNEEKNCCGRHAHEEIEEKHACGRHAHEEKHACGGHAHEKQEEKNCCGRHAHEEIEETHSCGGHAHEEKHACGRHAHEEHEEKHACGRHAHEKHEEKNCCGRHAHEEHEEKHACGRHAHEKQEEKNCCGRHAHEEIEETHSCGGHAHHNNCSPKITTKTSLTSAKIFLALKQFYESEKLDGMTIGCFDLLNKDVCHGTSCLALGVMNSMKEYSCACEGEFSNLLGMITAKKFFNKNVFMANLLSYTPNSLYLAHCTAPYCWEPNGKILPLDLDTHFESDIGIAFNVDMTKNNQGKEFSLFKTRANEVIVAPVVLQKRGNSPLNCRTQLYVGMKQGSTEAFCNNTLGNHHLLSPIPAKELKAKFRELGFIVKDY